MVAYLTSKIYPDNWFSIGVIPKEKKTTYDKNYDRDYSEQFNSVVKVDKKYYGYEVDEISWLEGHIDANNRFISSLKSSQRGIRHGTNGITSKGKRTVKGASAHMQRKYGKARLGFGTLTIPDYSNEQIKSLALVWSDVVRIFFQKLKREFAKVGAPNDIVGVTEIQEERFDNGNVIAPHIHFCYVCRARRNSGWYVSADRFRLLWYQTLVKKIGRWNSQTGRAVTFGASVDVKPVKKSVSSYLGKYMSKGGAVIERIWEANRQEELPHSWWTLSRPLRNSYKKSIKKIYSGALHLLFYRPDQALERKIIRWYKEIWIETGGESRLFGVVGYFYGDKQMHACAE